MKKLNIEKTIFLIDGSSFLYRAYYAIKPMHTSSGMTIQAVFGFCRMLNKLMKQFSPHYLALVWDSKGQTIREEIFAAYKATRQAPPSDLFEQKDLIKEFADIIELKQVEKSGIEADDLLYSLVQDFKMHGFTSVVVSSDKDMRQAVEENIIIFDPFQEALLDKEAIETKYGFPLEKLVFYFALIGDASDNIPGVRGIGPKGALDLVTQFNSLKDLYEQLDKVPKERTRELLKASRDDAFISEQLFTLKYYDLKTKLEDYAFDIQNWALARDFFARLEFKSLLKDLPEVPVTQHDIFEKKLTYTIKIITHQEDLLKLCEQIKQAGTFAFDTETTGLNPLTSELVGISLCVQLGETYYVPVGHLTGEAQLEKQYVLAQLRPLFENRDINKIVHHGNFDRRVMYHAGIEVHGVVFDTLVVASLVTQDWQRIGLKSLSEHYLKQPMIAFSEIVKKNGYKNFSYVPLHLAGDYAGADAHQTLALVSIMQEELKKFEQKNLFYDIELPLGDILFAMEQEGIILDTHLLKTIGIRVDEELEKLKRTILGLIPEKFEEINLNSPRQLEQLLFEELKLEPLKKTAQKTAYSTDQEVLQELAKVHIVPGIILKYRELFKLKSTYIDTLGDYVNPETARIHTTFSQTTTATGRLASFDPNLQNIPTQAGIRAAFIPPQDHLFLSADYSQIELRVLAYLSQDQTLVKAFLAGEDIHARTATGLFDVPLAQVTSEQRQVAKRINFSILYGLTPYGLSKDLGIPFNQAKNYIEKYLAQYPGVMVWMEKVIEETRNKGYVTTLWGRRRYLPGIYEKNKSLYELARRLAINTVAQGTAAEIMKIGMLNLAKAFKEKKLLAKMVLQIHDELLLAVPSGEQEATELIVRNTLQNVVQWNIPLIVTMRFGNNWHEVTK